MQRLLFGYFIESGMLPCLKCGSEGYIKNGCTYYGKQRYQCKDCKRQYVEGSEYRHISPETWELVDKLLLEKLPLTGIARVTGISESHLQNYVNRKLESVPCEAEAVPKKQGRLTLELDEMWSFIC